MNFKRWVSLFRDPELPIDEEKIDVVDSFNYEDLKREVFNGSYLTEGELRTVWSCTNLDAHPGMASLRLPYDSEEEIFRRYRRVCVNVDKIEGVEELKNELKLALYVRDCNVGYLCEFYEEKGRLYGAAFPAKIIIGKRGD